MNQRLVLLAVGAVAACAIGGGCRSGVELLPVSGVVTLDGKPVEQATVLFKPETGPVAYGQTDAAGRFELSTAGRKGAVPGKHAVSVTKTKVTGVGNDEMVDPEKVKTEWIVPQKYADPEKSGLTAEVARGKTTFEFHLKSK